MQGNKWSIPELYKALKESQLVASDDVSVQIIEGDQPTIQLNLNKVGGVQAYIALSGEQLIIDALLIESKQVRDKAAFNEAALRSRDLFPLSSIGLETMSNGTEVYSIYGVLDATSTLQHVITEVEALSRNIESAMDAFSEYFNIEAQTA